MAKFCTNARISKEFMRRHLLTKLASYKGTSSYGVNPWVRCASGNVSSTIPYIYLAQTSTFQTPSTRIFLIVRLRVGYSPCWLACNREIGPDPGSPLFCNNMLQIRQNVCLDVLCMKTRQRKQCKYLILSMFSEHCSRLPGP